MNLGIILKIVASQGLEQLYYNLIDAGIHTSLFEGEESHYNSNDLVDFRYVKIPFSSITDDEIKITKSDVNEYINDNESLYSSDPTRDLIYVRFDEKPSEIDESDFMTALEELTEDRVEFDINSNEKITYKGFKSTENNEDYINTNSAIKFYDSYVFKTSLSPKFAEEIFNLDKGELFGPYKEDGFVKTTKLIDTKILPDSAKVRHILIPYMGSFRSGPNDSKSKDEAKKTADSINNVLKRNRGKFNLLSLSSDQVSNENDGVIEFAYIDGFAPEFRDFSEKRVGAIDVVETDLVFTSLKFYRTVKTKVLKLEILL